MQPVPDGAGFFTPASSGQVGIFESLMSQHLVV
jgi:hypothetical protein